MKKQNVAAAILFCGFLFAIGAGYLLPKADFSEMEKRYLAQAPTLSLKSVFSGQWSRQAEEYLSECMKRVSVRNVWCLPLCMQAVNLIIMLIKQVEVSTE